MLIDIRHLLLLKANELVLLTREDGEIPKEAPGLGLFFRDTCCIAHYALRLHGTRPLLLMSTPLGGRAARIDLTNRALPDLEGRPVAAHDLSLRRTLLVEDEGFTDAIEIRYFGGERVILPVSLTFTVRFESMFALRGAPQGRRGRLHAPFLEARSAGDTGLCFAYSGADDVLRTLEVGFSHAPVVAPRTTERCVAHFELALEPQAETSLVVTCRAGERPQDCPPAPNLRVRRDPAAVRQAAEHAPPQGEPRLETTSERLAEAMRHSLADIAVLELRRGRHCFIAGGVPWFVGLFGRDSLIPAIQCLAYQPGLAAHAARTLASWQGRRDDPRTREEPGKILHELRVGEMAHLREVPQTPSYAAVDSTLLFLIAIARHAAWTGSLELFGALRPNIDRALGWLDRKAAEHTAGYVTYDGCAEGGQPVNQSWRDSGMGVLRADGQYPVPPLALVEVQGYAFQARRQLAGLLRRRGEHALADRLAAEAAALQARFQRDFWMEAEGCYCLALEQDGRQVASVTSNTAQVLWTGIASPAQAARIAERVMRSDMFSGWGVRTLSADHVRFAPLAYQQGSVWPFDNALIVSGLRRYGHDAAALRVAEAMLDMAGGFAQARLPEFIAGTQRRPGDMPTHTPRANPLQAWSAGAVPFMVAELLGLRVDGFARRLHVRRPVLPSQVDSLALHGLAVGGAKMSVRFDRRSGRVVAEMLAQEGACDLVQT